MSLQLNELTVAGNLTRNPEQQSTNSGKSVCQFAVAVNDKLSGGGSAEFFECVAWEKTAELIAEYHQKGDGIWVRGPLKTESWEDKKTGEKRSKKYLLVKEFRFNKSRWDRLDGEEPAKENPKPTQTQSRVIETDDGIPF